MDRRSLYILFDAERGRGFFYCSLVPKVPFVFLLNFCHGRRKCKINVTRSPWVFLVVKRSSRRRSNMFKRSAKCFNLSRFLRCRNFLSFLLDSRYDTVVVVGTVIVTSISEKKKNIKKQRLDLLHAANRHEQAIFSWGVSVHAVRSDGRE